MPIGSHRVKVQKKVKSNKDNIHIHTIHNSRARRDSDHEVPHGEVAIRPSPNKDTHIHTIHNSRARRRSDHGVPHGEVAVAVVRGLATVEDLVLCVGVNGARN